LRVSLVSDQVDAEVIRAKRVFAESKNTILAARDDLERHQRWLERLTAQPVWPIVSKRIEQPRQWSILSGETFRVVPTIGSLAKGRIPLSALGVFGIFLLATAVMWGTKSHVRDLPPVPVASTAFIGQTVAKTPSRIFVGQTVAKTPPRIRESVALPVRGSEAPPVAEDTLQAKPNAKIKSKQKVSRDESQLPWLVSKMPVP
jgi:hypothetical protein